MSFPENRYEVRAIVEGEQDQFLAQMCEAFGIDIAVARPIFFDDPFFDLSHKRVLVDTNTDQFISSLTIVPTAIRVMGGALIPVAGIANVCTLPEYQRKGFAQRLIRSTLQSVPTEFGYAVAALSTDQPAIYRSAGFEPCSTAVHWTAHRKLLPQFIESQYAEEINYEEIKSILPEIILLYDHSQASQPGTFVRSETRWSAILQNHQTTKVITWRNTGRLEGCLFFRTKEQRGDRVLEVLDLMADNAAATRGLIGYLRTFENIDLVSGQTSITGMQKLGIQHIPRFTSYKRDGVMLAIIDFDACLSIAAGTGLMTPVVRRSESGLTIRLENAISIKDRKPLRLFSVSTQRLGVAIGMAPADEITGDWISVDIGAMAQLFFGYRSASKLRSQDRLWISTDNSLAITESLFPGYDTYLGQLDAF